jgi:hypothetical protein
MLPTEMLHIPVLWRDGFRKYSSAFGARAQAREMSCPVTPVQDGMGVC